MLDRLQIYAPRDGIVHTLFWPRRIELGSERRSAVHTGPSYRDFGVELTVPGRDMR